MSSVQGSGSSCGVQLDLQARLQQSKTWAKWAPGLSQAIGKAILKWTTVPALERQRIMYEDQASVRALSRNERAFIEHCERDHLGFRRDCRTCLESSVRSHNHLRQKYQHRNAFTLNVDLIGPLTAGEDQLGEARHLLVGVLGVPLFRDGRPQPCGESSEEPSIPTEWEEERVEGPAPLEQEDVFQPEAEAPLEMEDPQELGLDARWEERAEQWNQRWRATIDALTEPVEVVPLVFVEPIASKRAITTLRGLQRIYTRIRLMNYPVRRIHSDSGREFANSLFEKWALSRDIAITASIPSDPRSHGRVEGFVGQCKAGVRGLLLQSGLSARCWPHLARQWGEQKLRWGLSRLGAEAPKRALVPAGTVVTVKKREWSRKTPWSSKAVQGVAVAPSIRVPDATIIRIHEGDSHRLYVAPVVYTDAREPVRFVGTAEGADLLDDLPAPGRRVVGKRPGVFLSHARRSRQSSDVRSGQEAAATGLSSTDGTGAVEVGGEGSGERAGGSGDGSRGSFRALSHTPNPLGAGPLGTVGQVSEELSSEACAALLGLTAWTPEQAERYSGHLLSLNRPPQRAELEDVFRRSLQDFTAKTRAVDLHAKGTGAKGWTLGFYMYGNKVGLTTRTRTMPNTVRLVNHYLASLLNLPEDASATWTAVRVTWGTQACLHKDRNMKGTKNWVVPISRFRKGRVWLAEDNPELLSEEQRRELVEWKGIWGRFHAGDDKGFWFDSSKFHAVEPADGDRIVVVAYTPRGLRACGNQDAAKLQELGFRLPPGAPTPSKVAVVQSQFGQEPQYFDISSDSEEDSSEGEWAGTGEPKDHDSRVARLAQLVREEKKALDEELNHGVACITPALLAELQEDLRVAELLQEHDECEKAVELGCSKFALHRLASVERALEVAWRSAETRSLEQVRALRVPAGSVGSSGQSSLMHVGVVGQSVGEVDSLSVDPVEHGDAVELGDRVEFDLCGDLAPGESVREVHPSFGLETPELTMKGAQPTPGALLQTRIVSQSEVWEDIESWRQPLTDEVTALKNVHQAVWPIGPDELKRLEQLATVSIIPGKGVYTQKPITNRLRARIVGCGNYLESEAPPESEAKGKSRAQDLYAGGVDGVSVRIQVSAAATNAWSCAGLDIKTAFLGAPLYQDQKGQAVLTPGDLSSGSLDFEVLVRKLQSVQGERVKIVVVSPPKILVRLGLVEESEKWLVIKALYGLAEAPRRWSAHRDLLLRQLAWEDNGRRYSLAACVADNNLWRIVSEAQPETTEACGTYTRVTQNSTSLEPGRSPELIPQDNQGIMLHGLLGVYVGDMLITAEDGVQNRLLQELRQLWSTSDPEIADVGRPLRFCGFNLHRLKGGGYLLNQEDYVRDLLQKFPDVQGTSEVPCLKEENPEPENPDPIQLRRAQALAGVAYNPH